MSEVIYHGRDMSDDRFDDLLDGVIPGSHHPIYEVEMPASAVGKEVVGTSIESSGWTLVGQYDAPVTGGFTASIGAGVHFSTSLDVPGVVLFLDRSRVPAPLDEVDYTYEWLSDHPGVFARIDQLMEGEAYHDGRLVGAGWTNESGALILQHTFDRLKREIEGFAYEDERELVARRASVDVRDAIVATATYAHRQKATGGSIQAQLAEFEGYRVGGFGRRATDVTRLSPEEQVEALYDEMVAATGGVVGADHHVLLFEDHRSLKKRTERFDPEDFVVAYDGDEFTRNPAHVRGYLGRGGVDSL